MGKVFSQYYPVHYIVNSYLPVIRKDSFPILQQSPQPPTPTSFMNTYSVTDFQSHGHHFFLLSCLACHMNTISNQVWVRFCVAKLDRVLPKTRTTWCPHQTKPSASNAINRSVNHSNSKLVMQSLLIVASMEID